VPGSVFAALILVGALLVPGLLGSMPRAQHADAALNDGELALRERRFKEAIKAFTTANEQQGRKSPRAFLGLCRAHNGLGAHGDAVKACEQGLKFVDGDVRLAAQLHNERGLALSARAKSHKDRALREAQQAFRSVVELTSEIPIAWFNLGVVAARQGADEESVAAFQAYLDSGAAGSEADLARELVVSPRRAREPVAPEFSVPTFDGQVVSLKSLRGHTVLLDFWATWCPPCRQSSPALVRLAKKYAGEPFSIVGISSDQPGDEAKVRRYVESYEMPWPQHLDASQAVHKAYEIDAFPTFIVIDGDGIVTLRMRGWSGSTEQRLDNEIRKNLKAGAERQRRFEQR
jgi:thiol-disulfide isomerase/thioredoxin